jgi:hypothetical protein
MISHHSVGSLMVHHAAHYFQGLPYFFPAIDEIAGKYCLSFWMRIISVSLVYPSFSRRIFQRIRFPVNIAYNVKHREEWYVLVAEEGLRDLCLKGSA